MTGQKSIKSRELRFLKKCDSKGVLWLHSHGFAFIRDHFLPALESFKRKAKSKADKIVLSNAYYLLGDVYDFNGAISTSIRAYRESIRFDPGNSSAWRELGNQYNLLNENKNSLKCLNHCLSINPKDSFAKADLEVIEYQEKKRSFRTKKKTLEAFYIQDMLAQGKEGFVLNKVKKLRSTNSIRLRAACLGIQGNKNGYLEAWESLAKTKGLLTFDYWDWFYMPEEIFNSEEIWNSFWKLRDRINLEDGIFVYHESLAKVIFPSKIRPITKLKKQLFLMLKYHIARTQNSEAKMRHLADQYPHWKEARKELERISKVRKKYREFNS